MIKKSNIFSLAIVLLIVIGSIYWMIAVNAQKEKNFDCWGRMHTRVNVDDCQKTSSANVFLSMHANGKGYLLASGTWSCQRSAQNVVDEMVNFNFEKQGDYYSLHPEERNPALEMIIGALRYNALKIKITRLNSADYILTLPNETLMICTED